MDLLTYWKLCERPFEATWDTRFYFRAPHHAEALERLQFLTGERSMALGMLTGEIGSGKTLVRAVFTEELDPEEYELVVQDCPGFGFREILGGVIRALDGDAETGDQSKAARFEQLRELLEDLYDDGRHLVLVLDEAQEMDRGTLNELKLLTNLNGDGRSYLTALLIGQPELARQLARIPALDQRVGLRFHLPALDVGQAAAYLEHRLRVAGHPTGRLFLNDAVEAAHAASRGIPRELNRIAKLALEMAWLSESKAVTLNAVNAVVRDTEHYQKGLAA